VSMRVWPFVEVEEVTLYDATGMEVCSDFNLSNVLNDC
jgi:hypothetical protein